MIGSRLVGRSTGHANLSRAFGLLRLGLLGVLTVWAVMYQLSDTLVPSLASLSPFTGVWQDILFALAGLVLLTGGRRPETGWRLIGLGCICWAAGDLYWTTNLSHMSSPPVPSWADAGYLAFDPLVFFGILSLVRRHLKSMSRMLVADAAAAALAAAAINTAVVVQPVLDHATGSSLSIATNLAYPVGDLVMLALLIGATALDEWRITSTWLLLGFALLAFWVADSFYLTAVATSTYSQGQAYNGLWYLCPVVAAWAAWLGFRRDPPPPPRGTRVRGIAMLLAVCVCSLSVLVWSEFDYVGIPAIVLATASMAVIMGRLLMTWRENSRLLLMTEQDALTDILTGLPNRRALVRDLEIGLAESNEERPVALVLFDLDGFKYYNDNFGHPAGDALLQRLGHNLAIRMGREGTAYRMGGDEFCALIERPLDELPWAIETAADALHEAGEGFVIGCSYGTVVLPSEAQDIPGALRLADQRMYAQKRRGSRSSASRQSGDVLLSVLAERDPELLTHVYDVADLAAETARSFGLGEDDVEPIRQGAELHDVGKMAIPDAIIRKPSSLNENEWAFVRRHTLIGERIINAAPALQRVAALVRSSHENFDGTGYPDRLAGEEIPLGARIIAVCDAFDAMTTDRPYRRAMAQDAAVAELRRCAGTQFDPLVVERFCASLALKRTGSHSESRPDVPSERIPRSPAPA